MLCCANAALILPSADALARCHIAMATGTRQRLQTIKSAENPIGAKYITISWTFPLATPH